MWAFGLLWFHLVQQGNPCRTGSSLGRKGWALSSQHLFCVLVESGMARRIPDVLEPWLGIGQKLLWPFLHSWSFVGQLTPSWPTCQERAGFGLWFLPHTALCSLPQCNTERCCGAVCSQRRTGGLSHGPECLYPCGATGSQAPLSPQVVPWRSRFQSRQSRCTRHRSKRLPLVTAALTLPRPLPAEQVPVPTFCLPS